jgi:tight adherence protein C
MSGATVFLLVGVLAIFAGLFLCLAAFGVLTNESHGVSRSLSLMNAFSAAPEAMQAELDRPFSERVLDPLLARFVGIGRRVTPSDYAERMQQKLDVAGNPEGWTVDRIVASKVVAFGAGLLTAGLLLALLSPGPTLSLVLVAAGGIIGFFAPNLYLYQRGYDRTNQIQRALPDALDLLTISVEAGLGFDAALAQVARNTEGPLAHELARVLQEMQIGLGRSKALRALGERTTLPDLRSFTSAMVQADAFGIPVGQVLRVQANEIRTKRRQRAEEQAQKIPVKIMIPLVLFILPCLFVVVLGPAILGMMDVFGSGGGLS